MGMYQQLHDIQHPDQLSDTVLRTADQMRIPNDPRNADRQAYEAWLEAGHTPDPPEPLPEPPQTVAQDSIEARLFALTERIEACEARLAILEES